MPKKKDKKKKGLGQEKTAAKTAKKAERKNKKEGAVEGEATTADDIDGILQIWQAQIALNQKSAVTPCAIPSPRCNATLTAHPTEDKLILYGGELFDGKVCTTFGDLYFYSIAKKEWGLVQTCGPCPLLRNSHQTVAVPRLGGQMWVFGGEFTSPKGDIRQYSDLWCLQLAEMKWDSIKLVKSEKGAKLVHPSARSGHRMIFHKNTLVLFGGFFDNGKDMTYYNDLYIFHMETMEWVKIPSTLDNWPKPRAGHLFFVQPEKNTAILHGGVNVEGKGDNAQTVTLGDMWSLDLLTYKWEPIKPKGDYPTPRSGAIGAVHKNHAVVLGGVFDVVQTELDLQGESVNDVHILNMDNNRWSKVQYEHSPSARRNAQMCVKGNSLYVFGGVYETKQREASLNDFFVLELGKKDEDWKCLHDCDASQQAWNESEDEEEDDEEEESEEENKEEEEAEDSGEWESGDEEDQRRKKELEDEVKIDTPLKGEALKEFFARSQAYWLSKAELSAAAGLSTDQNREKELRQVAFRMAQDRFKEVK